MIHAYSKLYLDDAMQNLAEACHYAINIEGQEPSYLPPNTDPDRSPEYWAGWVLAFYQWYTNFPFRRLAEYLRLSEVIALYPTLHEASELHFVDALNRRFRARKNNRSGGQP